MEPEFSVGPMTASYTSQRYEGRSRGKDKKVTFEDQSKPNTRANAKTMKFGPPVRNNSTEKEKDYIDIDTDKEESAEVTVKPSARVKAIPYVDVPPLKATLRTPVTEPIIDDQNSKNGPAYKTRAPVEIGVNVEKLVETVLDLEISVPLRSLAGVSGAIQKEIRKQVTKARMPVATDENRQVNIQIENETPLIRLDSIQVSSYMIMTDVSDEIPEGYMVASDPVLQYLNEHKDVDPQTLVVGKSHESLRSIYTTVNNVGQEECLLDNGSQIVSMGKDIAIQNGLTWDHSLRINMESASNHLEKTLGLSRNVRFSVGGLDFFLQVHILENPPYKVLLGRPFDTLTSSLNKSKTDGTSELVLTDPNTKAVVTVPTYERGVRPEDIQKQRYQAFQTTSRNL